MSTEKQDDGTWTYVCDEKVPMVVGFDGDEPIEGYALTCGSPGDGIPFTSTGHLRKKDAELRGEQHEAEHAAGQDIDRLKAEVTMARQNTKGYEKVSTKEKQAELDDLLDEVRAPELAVFASQIAEK